MAELIAQPRIIMAAGTKPKQIEEYVGRLNSGDKSLSIARMVSPSGWSEPGQTPQFDEYTVVLRGLLRVRTRQADLSGPIRVSSEVNFRFADHPLVDRQNHRKLLVFIEVLEHLSVVALQVKANIANYAGSTSFRRTPWLSVPRTSFGR
jgi:hypothetical protein